MPPFDFRASQIQTKQIIATGSFDDLGVNSQIAIYPIEAQDSPDNQGNIIPGLRSHLEATDVFLYVSGGIGEKDGATRAITVFGGDIHISGNMTIDGTGGGGGGGGSSFRPTASDFDTPYLLSGYVDADITDVVGGSTSYSGPPFNFLNFEFTDPTPNTIWVAPIVIPFDLPDRFKLTVGLFVVGTPPDDFIGGLSFTNDSVTKQLGLTYSFLNTPAAWVPTIDGGNFGSPSVTWNMPSATYGNATEGTLLFDSVQPFSATAPQLTMQYNLRGLRQPPTVYNSEKFFSFLPSGGSMTTDLAGEELKNMLMYFSFGASGFSGTININCWLDIQNLD